MKYKKKIELDGQNLIVRNKKTEEKIHISQVNKIDIIANEVSQIYTVIGIILVLTIIILLELNYTTYGLLILIIISLLIVTKEKSYEIRLTLKDRIPILLYFSKEQKKEYIKIVQEIKKQVFHFKIENDN